MANPNTENIEEVRKLASDGRTWGNYILVIETKIAEARELLHNQTVEFARVKTQKATVDARLNELGFQDVGHARGELAKLGYING